MIMLCDVFISEGNKYRSCNGMPQQFLGATASKHLLALYGVKHIVYAAAKRSVVGQSGKGDTDKGHETREWQALHVKYRST